MPRHVHLVGSVPLADAEAVFRTCYALLGSDGRLQRLPDGETGRRRVWIMSQVEVLARCPLLHFEGPAPDFDALVDPTGPQGYDFTRLALNEGADPAQLRFGPLGYADAAIASYAVFARLQAEGVLPPTLRMQVSLPTPFASIAAFIAPKDMFALLPPYTQAMLEELSTITSRIPPLSWPFSSTWPSSSGCTRGWSPHPPPTGAPSSPLSTASSRRPSPQRRSSGTTSATATCSTNISWSRRTPPC